MPILTLDNDIAEIDADAYLDAPILGYALIAPRHFTLKHSRTLDRIDHAAELGQQTVTHQLEDAAVVFGDFRFEQLLAVPPQAVERVDLVLRHQAAVADYVSGEDRGEVALSALFGHASVLRERSHSILLTPHLGVYRAGLPLRVISTHTARWAGRSASCRQRKCHSGSPAFRSPSTSLS